MYELLPLRGSILVHCQELLPWYHTLVRGLFMREELASSSALALRSSWLTVDMGWLTIALRKIFFTKKIGSENKFNFMIILTLSVFLISIKSQFSIFQCVIKLYSLALQLLDAVQFNRPLDFRFSVCLKISTRFNSGFRFLKVTIP